MLRVATQAENKKNGFQPVFLFRYKHYDNMYYHSALK